MPQRVIPRMQGEADPVLNRLQEHVRQVVNVGMSDLDKWIAYSTPSYAEAYENNETGTALSATSANTFYPWVGGSGGLSSGIQYCVWDNTNKRFVIGPKGAGVYRIAAAVAITGSGAGSEIQSCVHVNGQPSKVRLDSDFATAASYITLTLAGILELAAGDLVDLRFGCAAAGRTLTTKHVNFNVGRIHT